jgi:hypothetical protein
MKPGKITRMPDHNGEALAYAPGGVDHILMRQFRGSKRRRLLGAVLPTLVVVSLSILLVRQQGLTRSSEIAGVAAAAVALLAWLFGTSTDLTKMHPHSKTPTDPADDLAEQIRIEWEDHLADRSLHKPPPIRLRWSTSQGLSPPLQLAGNEVDVENLRDQCSNGALDEIDEIANVFLRLPRRRLIILGEPGSGKTVMAIRLTTDLIRCRRPGDVVPVPIPMASWNPNNTDLNSWIVRRLAQSYYADRTEIPILLMRRNVILPVLDGFDDIPEELRTDALNAIDRATHAEQPIVITCRTEDYSNTIRNAATMLANSMAIEIEPVAPLAAITYLRASSPLYPARWDALDHYMSEQEQSAVATALSTPLMVYLMRIMYASLDTDPCEVMDSKRFPSSKAVQEHLLLNYIESSYPKFPARLGQKTNKWDPRHAEKWLRALATRLNHDNTLEFNWWRLARRYSYALAGLVNLAILALAAVSGWFIFRRMGSGKNEVFGIYGALAVLAIAVTPISTLRLAANGTAKIQGPSEGRLALWHAIPVSMTVSLVAFVSGESRVSYARLGIAGTLIGFVTGYILWVIIGGIRRREWRAAVAAGALSRIGCTGVMLLGLALLALPAWVVYETRSWWWWPILGLPYLILFGGKGAAARMARGGPPPVMHQAASALNDVMRESYSEMENVSNVQLNQAQIVDPDSSVRTARIASMFDGGLIGATSTLTILALSGTRLPWADAAIFSISAGIGSAISGPWCCFGAMRFWLWIRRKSPLRLMSFLRDATQRGVLRQVGPSYLFRHSIVQEHLAKRSMARTERRRRL